MHSRQTLLLLLGLSLASCAGPKRGNPDQVVPIPPRTWEAKDATSEGEIDLDWWRTLGDPALTRAIELSLQRNHDIYAAQSRLAAAAAQSRLAGAGLMPTLDYGTNAQRARSVFVGLPFGGGGPLSNTFNTFGVNLTASWEIDIWNRIGAGRDASIADLKASAEDLRGLRQSIAGQVAKAWYAAVEARQQIALTKTSIASFQSTENLVSARFQRGVRSALDLRLARSQRLNAQAQEHQWQERYERAVRQLQLLQGRYPSGQDSVPAKLPEQTGAIVAGIPADAIRRRPDLIAAEQRLKAAGFRVDESQAALYPQLSISGTVGTTSDRTKDLLDLDFLIWNIAANLVGPILDGGARSAQRDAAVYREHEAVATFAQSILRAYTEIETLLATQGLVRKQVDSLSAASTEARAAENLSQSRYRQGLDDFINVLSAQRSALQIEGQRITTQRLLLDLRVDLHLALGGGFEPITPVNSSVLPTSSMPEGDER